MVHLVGHGRKECATSPGIDYATDNPCKETSLPESKVRKTAENKHKRSDSRPAKDSSKVGYRAGSSTRTGPKGAQTSRARMAGGSAASADGRRRWLPPLSIALAVVGVAWGVVWVLDNTLVQFMKPLGNWNFAVAAGLLVLAVVLFLALRPRTGTPYAPGSRRWVPPTFIGVGLFGVAWLIVYYVAGDFIPFMTPLGNWNILIGMAGMAAAFVIATLWK
jgi:hypothetical protein